MSPVHATSPDLLAFMHAATMSGHNTSVDTGEGKQMSLNNKDTLMTEVKDAKVASDEKASDFERQPSHADAITDLDKRLANPLKALSQDDVVERGRAFAINAGMPEKADLFAKGALLARDPLLYETLPLLDDEDRATLKQEEERRWHQPRMLYLLVICCSLAAVVQGEHHARVGFTYAVPWVQKSRARVRGSLLCPRTRRVVTGLRYVTVLAEVPALTRFPICLSDDQAWISQ